MSTILNKINLIQKDILKLEGLEIKNDWNIRISNLFQSNGIIILIESIEKTVRAYGCDLYIKYNLRNIEDDDEISTCSIGIGKNFEESLDACFFNLIRTLFKLNINYLSINSIDISKEYKENLSNKNDKTNSNENNKSYENSNQYNNKINEAIVLKNELFKELYNIKDNNKKKELYNSKYREICEDKDFPPKIFKEIKNIIKYHKIA